MTEDLSLREKALAAMKDAVSRVIDEHWRAGASLAVWRDGKVVLIPAPRPTGVREDAEPYDTEPDQS